MRLMQVLVTADAIKNVATFSGASYKHTLNDNRQHCWRRCKGYYYQVSVRRILQALKRGSFIYPSNKPYTSDDNYDILLSTTVTAALLEVLLVASVQRRKYACGC